MASLFEFSCITLLKTITTQAGKYHTEKNVIILASLIPPLVKPRNDHNSQICHPILYLFDFANWEFSLQRLGNMLHYLTCYMDVSLLFSIAE